MLQKCCRWRWQPKQNSSVANIISSDEAFYLKELPQKVLVVGGSYVAVGFASIFNGLGLIATVSRGFVSTGI